MQAIWKGTISFGLVTIPIKVYSATEERDITFRQVHEADNGRIRYRRVCEIDGEEVPYSDIGKGYEMPDGRMVILTNEDFAELPLPTAKAIDVLEFVPADQVDSMYFAKAYYLAADAAGVKPYVLFRDALTKTGQAALVKVAIRTREVLALLRERDGALVLQTMLWPDEVRDAEFAAPSDDVSVRKQEVDMAESYIATLKADFDPDRSVSRLPRACAAGAAHRDSRRGDPRGAGHAHECASRPSLPARRHRDVRRPRAPRTAGSRRRSADDPHFTSVRRRARSAGPGCARRLGARPLVARSRRRRCLTGAGLPELDVRPSCNTDRCL